ncbi:MAG: hypothetical protein MJ070_07255 [Lachnospiraceae bacterium]|nr:hypothetical protein [Lachnospiraceae bacterium]
MKKLLASLLVICTLIAGMAIFASAATYTQDAEMTYDWPVPSNAIWEFHFKPTDITGATKVQFEFFVETAENLKINSFELGSHKNSDWKEKTFNSNAGFGGLVDGWNTVTLTLSESGESNDTDPKDGTTSGWDPKTFQRIRMYNVDHAGAATKLAIKNIVALKDDGTEIKVGSETMAKEGAPIVIDAKNYAQFDSYMIEGKYNQHDGGLYTDRDMYVILALPFEGEPTSALLKLPAGNGFLISASKDNKEYTEIARSTVTGNLNSQDLELDLTDYLGKGVVYVKIEDATPADGNGAFINGGAKKTEFSVSYQTETPDEPAPATFDAVSSVAVAAVAALGVALVASKKRH